MLIEIDYFAHDISDLSKKVQVLNFLFFVDLKMSSKFKKSLSEVVSSVLFNFRMQFLINENKSCHGGKKKLDLVNKRKLLLRFAFFLSVIRYKP